MTTTFGATPFAGASLDFAMSVDKNAAQTGVFATVEHPEHGTFKTVAPPLRMSGTALGGTNPAPLLAADTADVLAEVGVDDETIALLVAAIS